jgi:zinc dependent phospholipase C
VAKLASRLVWLAPLALFSEDALAWGLHTHVYFSQLLIWAVPLADPRFRQAVAHLPDLMLAAACLPDVALFARAAGAHTLATTHQWSAARRLLAAAHDDETRAVAVGYASHLLCDVVAHNHFVPAHEQMWLDRPVVTHAAAEWMMDAHVTPHLLARPADLLRRHHRLLAECAGEHFGCAGAASRRVLRWLTNGETLLRASRLPQALRNGARMLDARLERRLDWYVGETTSRLGQINRLIEGDAPVWHPEIDCALVTRGRMHPRRMSRLGSELPLPQDFF